MIDVIIPNLKRNYSGVTSANRNVAPGIAHQVKARWLGTHRPDGIPALSVWDLLRLRSHKTSIIWHARRNNEMIIGLLLKWLGWPLVLIFTSAAQRHHTRFTDFLMHRMDHIIATSDRSAVYVPRRSHVIHHGVDIGRYAPEPDRDAAFARTGLPGLYAIGCFGRVRHQKGTDLFVEAMCRLLPKFPDYSAVIVGRIAADQQDFVRTLTDKIAAAGLSERIIFLGEQPIDDVVAWFRRISIFAFTSRVEGFGLTILEAMASGSAIVASRAGAAEVVVRDGIDGLLVQPNDGDGLTAAIEALLQSPDKIANYGASARQRMVDAFDLDDEVARTVAFYRSTGSITATGA